MLYHDEIPQFQSTSRFPTKAMMSGDFSAFASPLYDPTTGAPFAGNRVPVQLLDPVAAKLSDLLPLASTYGERYLWAYANVVDSHEIMAKLDHTFSPAHRLQLSFFSPWGGENWPATAQGPSAAPAFGPQIDKSRQQTASARHVFVVTPALVMQNRFALAWHTADRENAAVGRNLQDFGSNWPTVAPNARKYLPWINVSDGFNVQQGALNNFNQRNYRLSSNLVWMRGKHTVKFGGEYEYDWVINFNDEDVASLSFDGHMSSRPAGGSSLGTGVFGYSMADFVLGRAATISVQGIRNYTLSNHAISFFAQDDWRVTPRLTLTPGLRYEVYTAPNEANNRMDSYVPGHQSDKYPNTPPGLAFIGDKGFTNPYPTY
jgi:outer membrane receptor protein involved in Fe transport